MRKILKAIFRKKEDGTVRLGYIVQDRADKGIGTALGLGAEILLWIFQEETKVYVSKCMKQKGG